MARGRGGLAVLLALAVMGGWSPAGHWCEHVTIQYRSAPGAEPRRAIIASIELAKESVWAMLYSFTDGDIADVLVRAKAKGRDVRVMIDGERATEPGSVVSILVKGGIPVVTDSVHPIFHHKDWLIDGRTIITGSYNPTHRATRNAESSVEIESPRVAADVIAGWKMHRAHCESYPPGEP